MISVICCISDPNQFKDFCLPSLVDASQFLIKNDLQPIEIIKIENAKSIFEGYNRGINQAKHNVKLFVHQDVNLLDPVWTIKLLHAFASNPDFALLGLVGTQKLNDKGFWWSSGQQYIVGEVYSGKEKANWIFRSIDKTTPVECIDGFFMAMNRKIYFDETLTGFHLYDMDQSRKVARLGYNIGVVPHKAWHIGAIRDQDTDEYFNKYYTKWGL